MFVFLEALCARLFKSAVRIVKRVQTVFRHLKDKVNTQESEFLFYYKFPMQNKQPSNLGTLDKWTSWM